MAHAGPPWIFFNVIVDRCNSLLDDLDSLRALEYPSLAPDILLNCLEEAAQRLRRRAKELYELVGDSLVPLNESNIEATNIYDFLNFVSGELLPLLRRSSTTEVPSELVLPMERLARLVSGDCQVVVEAVPELNYYFKEFAATLYEVFSSVDLDDVLRDKGFPSELFRLQLCSSPPMGILMHCLLGHEIGHAVYRKTESDKTLLPKLKVDESAVKRLVADRIREALSEAEATTASAAQQLPLEGQRFLQYILTAQTRAICANWVRELFCDVVGVGLFGPAFVCCASVFLLPFSDIDHTTDSHPSARLRIQVALRALLRSDPGFGYRKLKDEPLSLVQSITKPWRDLVGERYVEPDNALHRLAFRSVTALVKDIVMEAKNSVHGKLFGPNEYHVVVPKLRARILQGIPPNEYSESDERRFKPAGIGAILNAGWLSYLEDLELIKNNFKAMSEEQIMRRFYGLVQKAVESSELQMRWAEGERKIRA